MSYYDSDCECVQGVEVFLDPRPYMPQYESPDDGSFKTGYPWIDKDLESEKEKLNNHSLVEKDEDGIDIDRVLNLYVQNLQLINKGYIRLVAYQVKSCYVKLDSIDKTWTEGRVSLIFQHIETGYQETIPVEIGKKTLIPDDVLYPGTIRIAALCLEKSSTYASILSESLDVPVNDPGISKVKWPDKPTFDVYYNYQVNLRNLTKVQNDMKSDIAAYQIRCLNLETELESAQSKIDILKEKLSKLEAKHNA